MIPCYVRLCRDGVFLCSTMYLFSRAPGLAQQSNMLPFIYCITFGGFSLVNTTAYHLGKCSLHLLLLKSCMSQHFTLTRLLSERSTTVQHIYQHRTRPYLTNDVKSNLFSLVFATSVTTFGKTCHLGKILKSVNFLEG